MQETELKFLVPNSKINAIKRQTHIKSAITETLVAHYFDTPEQELAKAGMALRIRQKGDTWVQTLKTNGDGLANRHEYNDLQDAQKMQQALANDSLLPDFSLYDKYPNLSIHDNSIQKQLIRQYATDIRRTKRTIKRDGNVIEVAFDTGKVIHGMDKNQQQALQEIEFELIEGDMAFLFEIAKTWCKRYNLCLSTVTKAERGSLLLAGQKYAQATSIESSSLKIDKNISQSQFLRIVLHHCLLHLLPNASAIADGSKNNSHVYQLQMGISRLYTALNFFSDFSQQINPNWALVLKQILNLLHEYHEHDRLKTKIQPMLETQGSPKINWQMNIKFMPIDIVQANDFQLVLLDLMQFALSDAHNDNPKPAKKQLGKIINKLFCNMIDISNDIDSTEKLAKLDATSQQQLHQRITNLRHISEFAAPLYKKKKKKKNKRKQKFLYRLTVTDKVFSKYHHHITAHAFYEQKAKSDPNAYFAVGWLTANNQHTAQAYINALKSLTDVPKFW